MKLIFKTVIAIIFIILIIITYFNLPSNKSVFINKSYQTDISYNSEISLMTYNIQRGIDLNGNTNLSRIAEIINDNDIKIVGLNEVDQFTERSGFKNQINLLANKTAMNYIYGPNLYYTVGRYGNALLTKYPIISAANHNLPRFDQNEPRGLIDATIILPDKKEYHVLITHLSVNREERKLQLNWLENHISKLDKPYFLMGDFNGELEFSSLLQPVINDLKTFPADKPVKQIDYIFTNANIELINRESFNTTASDHLPLYIRFRTV